MRKTKLNIKKDDIIKLYQENHTLKEIAIILDCSISGIHVILHKNNVKMRSMSKSNRKYNVNEDYFETIDSKDKAYFLGLLIADGYNSGRGISLSLQEKDYKIIEIFKKYINYEGKLHIKNKKNKNHSNLIQLNINNIKISKDLSTLGCIKTKSHFTYFPDIPEEFYSHFIRGVFDGDGCIRISQNMLKFSIIGNIDLIEKIQDVLIKNCNLNKTKLYRDKRCKGNIMSMSYFGTNVVQRIYEYLYKDCDNLFLTRKKEKFDEKYKKNYNNTIG